MPEHEPRPVVTQTDAGTPITVRGRRGSRSVTIDREWEVSIDGRVIGRIRYELVTRERRTGGRMYVDACWHSPGWMFGTSGRLREARTKHEAIERLVHEASKDVD